MTTASGSTTLEWPEVARRLQAERTVWLGTVGVDGAPHAAPVWLAVLDDEAFIFMSAATVKARNLRVNDQAVVHCADGEDVLIVSGRCEFVGHPRELPEVLDVFARKYQQPGDSDFLPEQDATADCLFRLTPTRALAWQLEEFEGSQRRWSTT